MSFHFDPEPRPGGDLMRRDADRFAAQEADPEHPASMLLYHWASPTLSFGYGQDASLEFDLEAVERAGVAWVQRPTGGRAILHDDEWTYSVVGGIADPCFGGSLRESYARVTRVVREGLRSLGVPLDEVAGARRPAEAVRSARVACFGATWGHEITVGGRKLAGAAQRRGRHAFLQQGTILVGGGHERLAEWACGTVAERHRLQNAVRAGTVTLSELIRAPRLEEFAQHLHHAWEAAAARRVSPSLDTERVET